MALTYEYFSSIKSCLAVWDQLVPLDHAAHSTVWVLLENSELEGLEFHYLLIRNDRGNAVGAACFQCIGFDSRHYLSPFRNRFLNRLEKRLIGKGFRILVCGNLLRIDAPGIFFNAGQTSYVEVSAVVRKFIQAFKPRPHAVLIKDLPDADHEKSWLAAGYASWEGDLTMKMDIRPDWKEPIHYEKSIKHHYSQRLRKIRRAGAPLLRRELSLEEIGSLGDRLLQLYEQVVQRQDIRMILVNKRYFIEMKRLLGSRFKVTAYFSENKMIAFASHIIYPEVWELHFIGMDYDQKPQYQAYFNILYDALDEAIVNGKKELELGRTARQAKSNLGAYPVYFRNLIRLRNPVVRLCVGLLNSRFKKSTGSRLETRNPFRRTDGN